MPTKKPIKISYLGSFTKIWDEEGIARSFEQLDCQVERFEETDFNLTDFVNRSRGSDLVIWAKMKIPFRLQTALLKATENMTTVCWIPDLYWGLGREWKVDQNPMFKAKYVCTPDGGNNNKWERIGINHHTLRQGIFDEYVVETPPDDKKKYDVIFVGSVNGEYPYRTKMIAFLKKKYGTRFTWFGHSDSDEVRGKALNTLYSSTKVVVGCSVYSPQYWSNRIYETIGRGGFMIHPNVPGLDHDYTPYEHFIPYNYDYDQLYGIIEYYLNHPEERDKIRRAGMEYTRTHHTLLHRCRELLRITNLV